MWGSLRWLANYFSLYMPPSRDGVCNPVPNVTKGVSNPFMPNRNSPLHA